MTVSALVSMIQPSMIQPNTLSCVSQLLIFWRTREVDRKPHVRPTSGNGRRHPPYSTQETSAVRPPLHLDDNAIVYVVHHENLAPGVFPRTRNGPTITRDSNDPDPPLRGKPDVRNGSSPLLGNVCALKRRVGVSMLECRFHQPPIPRAVAPTELQAQIYDHIIAEHAFKGRRAYRVNHGLPKGIFDVDALQEDWSTSTVCLLRKRHP